MHPWIPIVHFGQASSSSLSVRCCLALVDLEAIIAPLRMHLLLNPSLPSFSGDLSTTTFPMSRPLSIATREGTVLIQHLLKALLELVGQQPWMGLCGGLATGGSDVQVARQRSLCRSNTALRRLFEAGCIPGHSGKVVHAISIKYHNVLLGSVSMPERQMNSSYLSEPSIMTSDNQVQGKEFTFLCLGGPIATPKQLTSGKTTTWMEEIFHFLMKMYSLSWINQMVQHVAMCHSCYESSM
uniref:CTP synthase n=1 Tax=Anthurium amnicola TaxID=1678845 RepID=A0A1D1YED3_9ARAE